jgi:hypothetical protein
MNWARLKLSMQLKETEKRGGAKTRREKNRLTEEQNSQDSLYLPKTPSNQQPILLSSSQKPNKQL